MSPSLHQPFVSRTDCGKKFISIALPKQQQLMIKRGNKVDFVQGIRLMKLPVLSIQSLPIS